MPHDIDTVNKSILICVFLMGMLSGATIGVIVTAYFGGKNDRNWKDSSLSNFGFTFSSYIFIDKSCTWVYLWLLYKETIMNESVYYDSEQQRIVLVGVTSLQNDKVTVTAIRKSNQELGSMEFSFDKTMSHILSKNYELIGYL